MWRRSILAPNLPPFVLKTSAVFVPSKATEPFRLVTHTQKTKKHLHQLDFTNEVYGSSLYMSCLSSRQLHTQTHTQRIYIAAQEARRGHAASVTHACSHTACDPF